VNTNRRISKHMTKKRTGDGGRRQGRNHYDRDHSFQAYKDENFTKFCWVFIKLVSVSIRISSHVGIAAVFFSVTPTVSHNQSRVQAQNRPRAEGGTRVTDGLTETKATHIKEVGSDADFNADGFVSFVGIRSLCLDPSLRSLLCQVPRCGPSVSFSSLSAQCGKGNRSLLNFRPTLDRNHRQGRKSQV
jgi:hypothetical protein